MYSITRFDKDKVNIALKGVNKNDEHSIFYEICLQFVESNNRPHYYENSTWSNFPASCYNKFEKDIRDLDINFLDGETLFQFNIN